MASETDQILHAHNPDSQPKEIPEKWRPAYDRLLALRDKLIDSHQDLTTKAREVQPDALKNEPGEIGTESFQRDYALAMASTEQDVLAEIQGAIGRIEAGTYGVC
jgi:DnaK suppressor protein